MTEQSTTNSKDNTNASPIQHSFKFDVKIYPVKCPCCGTMVEFDKPVYPKMYPIGKTKAKFSAKAKPRKQAPKVEVTSVEDY